MATILVNGLEQLAKIQTKKPAESDISITIVIRNHCNGLQFNFNKYCLKRGCCPVPPPAVIDPCTKATCIFRNARFWPLGTFGLISYDARRVFTSSDSSCCGQTDRLVLLWSLRKFKQYTGIGIKVDPTFDEACLMKRISVQCREWFHEQLSNKRLEINGYFAELPVVVFGTISNSSQVIWNIDILDQPQNSSQTLKFCQKLLQD